MAPVFMIKALQETTNPNWLPGLPDPLIIELRFYVPLYTK